MTQVALSMFSVGAIVLWGGLLVTLTIAIKKDK